MPRETIQTDGLTERPVAVEVSWGRATHVQLATVRPDGSEESGKEGVYSDLTREQINKLIRLLRKARDQAFGADE